MLIAEPKNFFSGDFRIFDDNKEIAFLDSSVWKESAQLKFENETYEFNREKSFSGLFRLMLKDRTLLKAEKPSAFSNKFEIEFKGAHYTLKKGSVWKREFHILKSDRIIGSIKPLGVFTQKTKIDLPENWLPITKIFLFWLVSIIWKRENSAGGAT
ncbi:MAG: hypothetical protein K9J12_08190 [Melioribacteraceae bacterium]|nr:hypothetical protein [Melioribacteraceae bacterium]MCF8264108.1 hypothetical protein [Melioribacteraceae bacterium]MCF8413338.1 hypothetical protein [Melioribacteraceae bacterium]MCF8431485.1 hypothetical protein [Melioribacteraceae bacterium]